MYSLLEPRNNDWSLKRLRRTLLRAAGVAVCAFTLCTLEPAVSKAATFDPGVTIRVGFFPTLTAPPDIAAAAALLPPANNITLTNAGFGGFDFAIGDNSFDLSGMTIQASCIVSAPNCSSFPNPADPDFFALIISDTGTPGGALDPIVNVTSSVLSASQIFFDANTIILDLSGLLLAAFQNRTELALVFRHKHVNPK